MSGVGNSNRILVVEGDSDRQVVRTILRRVASEFPTDDINVEDAKGVGNVINTIHVRLTSSPFDSNSPAAAAGIIVDADDDIARIWHRVVSQFKRAGVNVPPTCGPAPGGSIFVRPKPHLKVGVWVMPNNKCSGELEDFLASMVPREDTDWPLARKYVHSTKGKFGKKRKRAEVWAWIATRKYPSRFDEAIKNGDLCTDGELCQRFIAWLNRLFAVEDSAEGVGQRP